jgi:hypothetical protein
MFDLLTPSFIYDIFSFSNILQAMNSPHTFTHNTFSNNRHSSSQLKSNKLIMDGINGQGVRVTLTERCNTTATIY